MSEKTHREFPDFIFFALEFSLYTYSINVLVFQQ